MTAKTEQEINDEKARKPRPDLIPATAEYEEARAWALGVFKHGGGATGRGTYRDAGTKQSDPNVALASVLRHINAHRRGELIDPDSGDAKLLHLACARAQLGKAIDLVLDPPVRPGHENHAAWLVIRRRNQGGLSK